MDKWDFIIIGGVAVAGYLLYKKLKPATTTTETVDKLASMGFKSYEAGGSTYLQTKNENLLMPLVTLAQDQNRTYKFEAGDYDKLNLAQKILLSTRIIPPSWILG